MNTVADDAASPAPAAVPHAPGATSQFTLMLGSVGVVYGDIGTSPLYAFREAALAAAGHDGMVTREIVLGVLSMIVWALIVVVTLKYVLLLLRADNNGEGGPLSLMALASRAIGRRTPLVLILGVIGASMFLGDSVITPAISVLSAVEGLKLVTPRLEPFVIPLTIAILIGLFAVQRRGTAKVAAYFGPIMVVWFLTIAVAGLLHVSDDPGVFAAINPLYAIEFVAGNPKIGLVTLGAVFLVVTGGEALYADLGHFGRKPIQMAWLGLVLPALLINYFGQGALVLSNPAAIVNPFYRLMPEWMLLPMVLLATAATVIASQAVITGAFSLVRQAIQLGLMPRLTIVHTSAEYSGQIYIPRVNILLLLGVLTLVVLFRSSGSLAAAYGIAVATTTVVDGLLGFIVVWKLWRWPLWRVIAVVAPLILFDFMFFSANLLKLLEGAWVPLLFGVAMMLLTYTWQRGTRVLGAKTRKSEVPLVDLVKSLEKKPPHIVSGTAVFLTSEPDFTPTALLHNFKHNKVLHTHNVVLTIVTTDTPRVADEDRVTITPVSAHFTRIALKFGYMETPNVPKALVIARRQGWSFDIMSTSFFLSRRALKPATHSVLPRWQDRLFIALAKSSSDATDFFQIPTGRVVEVGTQVTI